MKKQKTLLIVVLVVAVAMAGLYLAMGIIGGENEKTGDDAKAVVMLTEMEDVTYVQYKNAEGTVTLTKTESAWKCEENAELDLVDEYVDEKAAVLGKIEGTLIADADKVECGLEEPAYELVVKNAEKEVKLVLSVNEEGYCYAMLEGKSEIYEISEDVIQMLNMSAESYAESDGSLYSYLLETEEDTLGDESLETGKEIIEDTIIEEEPENTPIEEPVTEDVTSEETTTEDLDSEE